MAQQQDLLVILRPGPYICSEWDFGGLPSWLNRTPQVEVRSIDPPFLKAAINYITKVSSVIAPFVFPRGGPVIAVQVENEYGSFGYDHQPKDTAYLKELLQTMKSSPLQDFVLYFTSDTPRQCGDLGAIPGVLQTANAQTNIREELMELRRLQPEEPLMAMEFWSGWFDHWLEPHHHVWKTEDFLSELESILRSNASVNVYMFHGGTNFGFLAGANVHDDWPFYLPDVTSYDYDALLSENGDYTPKYEAAREMLGRYSKEMNLAMPQPPLATPTCSYPEILLKKKITLAALLPLICAFESEVPLAMEDLPCNRENGQSFGYILYRATVAIPVGGAEITLSGHVRDLAALWVGGKMVSKPFTKPSDLSDFGGWIARDASIKIPEQYNGSLQVVDILVENLGRVNHGKPHHFRFKKGLSEGPVLLNGNQIKNWSIFPLEFKDDFINSIVKWESYLGGPLTEPTLLEGTLEIQGQCQDTFIDATPWGKGAVFVNGFNLGRFWEAGPQQTLYLPAPLLHKGSNKICLWVQFGGPCGGPLKTYCHPNLGLPNPTGITPGSGGPLVSISSPENLSTGL